VPVELAGDDRHRVQTQLKLRTEERVPIIEKSIEVNVPVYTAYNRRA
jgi:hypothetical protein